MPDSNWSIRVAALGASLLLALVALGIGAGIGASHTPNYGYQTTESADRRAQAEQAYPTQIDRDRPGLPYLAERVTSAPDPSDGTEREQRDLAAQESMSVWAFWLLIVSGVGTVTTMIGTGFLLWQIMLTREAVQDTSQATDAMREANFIARDTAQRQLRAYVHVVRVECHPLEVGKKFRALITVANKGPTPAYNVNSTASIARVPAPADLMSLPAPDLRDQQSVVTYAPGGQAQMMPELPVVTGWEDLQAFKHGQSDYILSGAISYSDAFGVQRETRFLMKLDRSYDFAGCEIGNTAT